LFYTGVENSFTLSQGAFRVKRKGKLRNALKYAREDFLLFLLLKSFIVFLLYCIQYDGYEWKTPKSIIK
jgi:hypothetical protein